MWMQIQNDKGKYVNKGDKNDVQKKMDKTLRHILQNKEYKLIKNSKHVLESTNGKISQHDQDHKNVAYHLSKQRSKLQSFFYAF